MIVQVGRQRVAVGDLDGPVRDPVYAVGAMS